MASVDSGAASPAQVTVLYFAALRDLARTGEERVSLTAVPTSIAALLQALEERHVGLAGRLASVRVAVDEEFAEVTRALSGGEVVALIPPVSGG